MRSAALSSAKATIYRRELEKKLKSGEASVSHSLEYPLWRGDTLQMPRPAPSSVPSMRTVSRIAVPQGAITPSIPAGEIPLLPPLSFVLFQEFALNGVDRRILQW